VRDVPEEDVERVTFVLERLLEEHFFKGSTTLTWA
jgi:hypothetical protein